MAQGNCKVHTKVFQRGRLIRVLLVDGDPVSTVEIAKFFSRHRVQVAVAKTLAEARALLRKDDVAFDVVIFELRLPDGRGELLLPELEGLARQPAIIITSSFLPELRAEALEYRPIAVSKPVSTAALLRMVQTVVGGYARPVIKRFVTGFSLTKRETEAMVLVARGLRAKEIAEQMDCSEQTVYCHLTNICTKTGCTDYHEIVAKLFSFACQAVGHTPPDHKSFAGSLVQSEPHR
jgi:DNA-binding NarL/FixJ family response regulator